MIIIAPALKPGQWIKDLKNMGRNSNPNILLQEDRIIQFSYICTTH